MIKPSTKIYRKNTIEGYAMPAIIHNMNNFFVDLDVYENGRVHCWNFEDFDHFVQDVRKGWVIVSIPDSEAISIHSLGKWTITKGEWHFNTETFIEYVKSLVKDLNPKWENIFTYSTKKINGVTIGENGNGTVFKEFKKTPNALFPDKIDGNSVNLFYRIGNDFFLIKVNVFADGTIQLSRLETPIEISLTEFEQLVNERLILTDVPIGSSVQIYGLGKFTILGGASYVDIHGKLLEIKDMLGQLKGEPSLVAACRQIHKDYLENPTVANQQQLKVAYENIPEHQRAYVGDMDTKDIEVRMIIYGEQEIENWSHYQLAKELGDELPTIKIPKLKDKS